MNRHDRPELCIAPLESADWGRAAADLGSRWPADELPQTQETDSPADRDAPLEVWGAQRENSFVAVMRVQVLAGRSAVIAAPRLAAGEPEETGLQLLLSLLNALRQRQVQVVQALVADAQGAEARLLTAAGLKHVAELEYLVSLTGTFPSAPPVREDLLLEPYAPQQHARLAQLVERTYEGSLDCRAAEGMRAIDDVLADYRGTKAVEAGRWLIARERDRDSGAPGNAVGCLIMADDPTHKQSELMYIGVTPEARGRGLGLSLVRHAQWMTGVAGRTRLVLAVDAANDPAMAMYTAAGFISWERRSVFLRALGAE
jgi:mycothiol synthase